MGLGVSVLPLVSKGTVQGQAGTAPLLVMPHAGSSLGGGKPAWLAECILGKGFGLFCADKYSADAQGTLAMAMLPGVPEMLQP